MESSKNRLLELHPDTVEYVRKEINLDKPGRIDEALDLLEEWVKMQNHFVKKDIPRIYLETTLVTAKGSIERAKQKLDKLCTLRTLMPEFFPTTVTKEIFTPLEDFVIQAHLPKLTKEHNRVYMLKILSDNFDSNLVQTYYKYIVVASEYCKRNDYNAGFVLICDYRDINILNFVTKISPMNLKHIFTLMTEGYGMRIKKILIMSGSKMVDSLVSLFKQTLSAKLGERIDVLKNLDSLHEVIEKDMLPEDFGGKEKPLRALYERCLENFCSKDNVDFFLEMNKAKTDETCRQSGVFNEQYVGMPGSFRALSVD
ncbi:unnamed protein product [Arctia plantaginis]|uniref:CRAL-TRIO domain-containing protein n=1 Tax=Arctia plantaginis TaxID=874455 RepID=A0A8S0YUW2_ARCPL|nr:unnamed protein product [Arctia plantaginis]